MNRLKDKVAMLQVQPAVSESVLQDYLLLRAQRLLFAVVVRQKVRL